MALAEPTVAFGIAPTSAAKLRKLFSATPRLKRVWIYGSRGRGDHREASDIDLAADAPEMSTKEFSSLCARLEDVGLIYRVDLVHLQSVLDEEFRGRIERDKKLFWRDTILG